MLPDRGRALNRSQNGHHPGSSLKAATVARKVATAVVTSVIRGR